jgi:hypothetical protein
MAFDDGFVVYLTKFLHLRKFRVSNGRKLRELIRRNLEESCRGLLEGTTPAFA